ncbi:CoA ester lyase [Nocardioides zeae]|uniref:CoA ester lyase n=1 Tax=Nocardioides imazamoxiresistens TaxID=3231893 RepID=A0ABU3PWJ4_9ACTN|nr:CoA ester lyase [Nocardioides zeae]MDT9593604.1 CoA ester lyase [Nocardioides zeae]
MTGATRPARSLLYVPGDREGWAEKAARSGADALILDLEDAVAPPRKDEARRLVGALTGAPPGSVAHQLWVRIDAAEPEDDLDAVVGPGLHTVVVPKAEPDLVDRVARRLDELEARRSLRPGSVGVVALLESARGIATVDQVAAHPRVRRLAIGEADLAAELGMVPGPDREEMAPLRNRVVLASALAGIERPIGPVHTVLDDPDGLRRSCQVQFRQGFRGRTAVHPRQVAVIAAEFAPTAEEVERARALLAEFEASRADGKAAYAGASGSLVDPATVRRAREIVAEAAEGQEES